MIPLFIIRGKVREGKKRGRLLHFPTANTRLHKVISDGIYISELRLGKCIYKATTFIGEAKTYHEHDYKAETYILDFDQNIYGAWVTIWLLKKIRENKAFHTEKELITQMERDINETKAFFKNYRSTIR